MATQRSLRNVRWQFGDIVPDYLLGRETACLFLSLRSVQFLCFVHAAMMLTSQTHCRYHLLKPEYIHGRIKSLQRSYRLRIVLCHVDTEDAVEPLAQVRILETRSQKLVHCVRSTSHASAVCHPAGDTCRRRQRVHPGLWLEQSGVCTVLGTFQKVGHIAAFMGYSG